MNILINLCALCTMVVGITMLFSKKEDSNIVAALYMVVAWLILIYNKIN